jgi:hypothetical protein
VVLNHPVEAAGKAGILAYRILLFASLVVLGLLAWKRLNSSSRAFVAALATFALVRTVALSYQTSIDNRYMISAMAAAEVVVALLAGLRFLARSRPELRAAAGHLDPVG